jgi:hypothetical protein
LRVESAREALYCEDGCDAIEVGFDDSELRDTCLFFTEDEFRHLQALYGLVTEIVNAKLPLAVGVPEITPVEAFRLKPAGKVLPEASIQV